MSPQQIGSVLSATMKVVELFPLEFEQKRQRLLDLLLETVTRFDDGRIQIQSDRVILSVEGSGLVGQILAHLIDQLKVSVIIAASDETAFPMVGSLLTLAFHSHLTNLKGGTLLLTREKGTRINDGDNIVIITDEVRVLTLSNVGHLKNVRHCNLKGIIALVAYQSEHEKRYILQSGVDLTAIFTLEELKSGQLDHSRFPFS